MKLSQALKEKKRLAAEIAHLKNLIHSKNSYLKGGPVREKFDVAELHSKLEKMIQELVNLKIAINEANREIQPSIYLLAEYKALITFWSGLNVSEGPHENYNDNIIEFECQYDELKKIDLVKAFQEKADRLQDEIDLYNFTTEVAWGDDYLEDGNTGTPPTEE